MTTTSEQITDLYVAHGRSVRGLLLRLTHGDYQTAEDLTQETFIRAWRHAGRLPEAVDGQRRWLMTVAHRLVIDDVRAKKARPSTTVLADHDGHRVADSGDCAVATLSVIQACRGLTPEQRTVLADLHLRGRAPREVAARLGIPVGTVNSRAHYALKALRESLHV